LLPYTSGLSLRHYLVLVIPIKFFADSSSVVYEMRAVGWKIVRNDFGLWAKRKTRRAEWECRDVLCLSLIFSPLLMK